jgi:hypothetical protein
MLRFYGPLLVYLISFPIMFITLLRVEIGLLFFISIVPVISLMVKIQTGLPIGNQIPDLLLIAMILGWVFRALREGQTIFKKSNLNLVVIIVVLGSVVDLIRGYTYMGFSEEVNLIRLMAWKNYMILPVLYFISLNNIDNEKMVKWIMVCIGFVMLAMVFNFYSTFRWLRTEHYSDSIRISGPLGFLGPNELGLFFTIYTFLLLGISYFIDDKKLKYFILLVCALNFYPILFSYSRAAYSTTLAGFLILGLLKDRKFLLLLVVLLVLYSLILPRSVVERIKMTFLGETEVTEEKRERDVVDVGGVELDTVRRKELWDKAMQYFEQEPVIGIGFDTFRHREGMITHSLFLKILAEQGLVGMAIFLAFILTILWQSYKLFRRSRSKLGQGIGLGFFTCVILHLVGTLGGDTSLYYNFMAIFWLFLGIIARFNIEFVSKSDNAKAGLREKIGSPLMQ